MVAFERNGRPVADAARMTATFRNGILTRAGGAEADRLRPMRLEFAGSGIVRAVEGVAADAGGTGTERADRMHARTGDYFVVSLNDPVAATGTGPAGATGAPGSGGIRVPASPPEPAGHPPSPAGRAYPVTGSPGSGTGTHTNGADRK